MVGILKSVSCFWHKPLGTAAKALIVTYYAFVPLYLVWLATYFVSWDHPITALAFVISEFFIVSVFLLLTYICWRPTRRIVTPPLPDKTVDVFITTLNEDLEGLRQSIRHCIEMDYPHTTWVLDDGCRPEVQRLAEGLGARYIGRRAREHAKAGNLNHALKLTNGEFIALFDADGIPKRNFLTQLLGHFRNPKVAIVQANQMIYNLDSFQHSPFVQRDTLWTEDSIFWDIIQSGKDRIGGNSWCGSGSLLRRSALEDVGGVATETVTEDFHTTLLLQAKGYQIVFHPEVVSYKLGPRDYESFIGQRNRWSTGTIQSIKHEAWMIFGRSPLTLNQRLCAMAAFFYYSESAVKILSFMLPALVLWSGGVGINSGYAGLLILFQVWLLRGCLFYIVSRGRGSNRIVGAYWYMKMWPYLRNLARGLLPVHVKFFVTPKEAFPVVGTPKMAAVLGTMYAILCICAACVMSIAGEMNPGLVFVAVAGVYQLRVCLEAVRLQMRRSWVPDSFAFLGAFPIRLRSNHCVEGAGGTTRLVSRTELWLTTSHTYSLDELVDVEVFVGDTPIKFHAKVVEMGRQLAHTEWALHEMKLRMPPLPLECWDVIFDYCLAIGPDTLIQRDPASLSGRMLKALPATSEATLRSPQRLPDESFAST